MENAGPKRPGPRPLMLWPCDYVIVRLLAQKRSAAWVNRKLWKSERRRLRLGASISRTKSTRRRRRLEDAYPLCGEYRLLYLLVRREQLGQLTTVAAPVVLFPQRLHNSLMRAGYFRRRT